MTLVENLLYKTGVRWSSSRPKTTLDRYFNRKAKVYLKTEVTLGGKPLTEKTLQILAGCPAGGTVRVSERRGTIVLKSQHDKWIENENDDTNIVWLERRRIGYVLYLDYIWFSEKCAKAFGAVAFLRMAQLAQQLGFVQVVLLAAGGTGIKGARWSQPFWGYETWPRLGFDTHLHPAILGLIQQVPHLSGMTKVSQIIAADLPWWKTNGDGAEMSFDLTPNSTSWETLHNFISGRGILV